MIRTIKQDLSLMPDDLTVPSQSDQPKRAGGLFIKEMLVPSRVDMTEAFAEMNILKENFQDNGENKELEEKIYT